MFVLGAKRGPRFGQLWKVHVFLLGKHNDEFVPSCAERARLSRAGMGMFYCVNLYSSVVVMFLALSAICMSYESCSCSKDLYKKHVYSLAKVAIACIHCQCGQQIILTKLLIPSLLKNVGYYF